MRLLRNIEKPETSHFLEFCISWNSTFRCFWDLHRESKSAELANLRESTIRKLWGEVAGNLRSSDRLSFILGPPSDCKALAPAADRVYRSRVSTFPALHIRLSRSVGRPSRKVRADKPEPTTHWIFIPSNETCLWDRPNAKKHCHRGPNKQCLWAPNGKQLFCKSPAACLSPLAGEAQTHRRQTAAKSQNRIRTQIKIPSCSMPNSKSPLFNPGACRSYHFPS